MRLARASPTALSARGVSWDPRIHNGHPRFVLLGCSFSFFSCTWKYQHDTKYFDHVLGILSSLWLFAGGWKTCWGKIGLWFVPEIKWRLLDSSEWYLRWMSNELTEHLDWCIRTKTLICSPVSWKHNFLWCLCSGRGTEAGSFAPVNEEAWHQSALKPKIRPIIPANWLGQTQSRPLLGFCDNPRCWIL